jgi:hypothetical protein
MHPNIIYSCSTTVTSLFALLRPLRLALAPLENSSPHWITPTATSNGDGDGGHENRGTHPHPRRLLALHRKQGLPRTKRSSIPFKSSTVTRVSHVSTYGARNGTEKRRTSLGGGNGMVQLKARGTHLTPRMQLVTYRPWTSIRSKPRVVCWQNLSDASRCTVLPSITRINSSSYEADGAIGIKFMKADTLVESTIV